MLNNSESFSSSSSSSRPSIAFPLGLALLVLVLVCLSGLFCCCYHWNKLRSLLCYSTSAHDDDDQSSLDDQSTVSANYSKSIQVMEQKKNESLTILMPGDDVPKFVALPTPHRSILQLEMLV
ncbi:hypothetical protein P3S67_000556 [Capsicum chacoense]